MKREDFQSSQQFVSTVQGEISLIQTGSGPPALFVHGLMLNGSVWRRVVGELCGDRTCLIPDLLGHGRTQVSDSQDLSISSQADMLADLCAALDLDQVDVVANDFGGAVAQTFTVAHPDRVRSLTLTNCDVHYNLGPPVDLRRLLPLAQSGVLGDMIERMLSDLELARSEFPGKGFEDRKNLSEADIVELVGPGVASTRSKRAFEKFILSVRGDELVLIESELGTCTVPTYLVWGTDDPYFGLPWAYWLRDRLNAFAGMTELHGASLFAPIERPKEVAEAIAGFWQSMDGQSPAVGK